MEPRSSRRLSSGRELAHALEVGNQRGIKRADFRIALEDFVHVGVCHAGGGTNDAFDIS